MAQMLGEMFVDQYDDKGHLIVWWMKEITVDGIFSERDANKGSTSRVVSQPMVSAKEEEENPNYFDAPWRYVYDGYDIDEEEWLLYGRIRSVNPLPKYCPCGCGRVII